MRLILEHFIPRPASQKWDRGWLSSDTGFRNEVGYWKRERSEKVALGHEI